MTAAAPAQQARILWQIAFDRDVTTTPLALADGVVVTLAQRDAHTLRRLRLDGGVLWEVSLDAGPVAPPVRSGHLLAVALDGGRVAAFDLTDGTPRRPRWAPLGGPVRAPVAAQGGHIYVRVGAGAEATLVALARGHERPRWQIPDPSGGGPRALLRLTDGVLVYAGTRGDGAGVVVCGLDPATGGALWAHDEPDCAVGDLWAVGGVVDVVTTSHVVGLDPHAGTVRNTRFANFPLEDARATGDQLVAMMQGHTGPVLLCFDLVSQRLHGRVSRAMTGMAGAHPNEVMVTLVNGEPALYALPSLAPVGLPEAGAAGTPRHTAWSRDVCYVVPEHGRALTAIDLEVPTGG